MTTPEFVPASTIFRTFDISRGTLIKWADQGLVDIVRLPGGQKRLYRWSQLRKLLGADQLDDSEPEPPPRIKLAYARVSSEQQRPDLVRQVQDLQLFCGPDTQVLSDVGSGLDYNRPHFRAILERVQQGVVESVTVAHRDRLSRYGIELVETIFKFHHCRLVVQHDTDSVTSDSELAQDLLTIVNVLVAPNNTRPSGQTRRRRAARAHTENQEVASLSDPHPTEVTG